MAEVTITMATDLEDSQVAGGENPLRFMSDNFGSSSPGSSGNANAGSPGCLIVFER